MQTIQPVENPNISGHDNVDDPEGAILDILSGNRPEKWFILKSEGLYVFRDWEELMRRFKVGINRETVVGQPGEQNNLKITLTW